MNFYIDKPTLSDIPAMRNLVLPEVQKGIILDRSEDEMAGVIRSYSVIRVVDSANLQNSQNLVKNNPCEAPENSPASWCKKSGEASSSASADFLLEAEKRGTLPKSEKRQLLARRGSGAGGAALLRKEKNKVNGWLVESSAELQNRLPRRFCESARNDEFIRDSSLTAQNDKIMDCHADSANLLAMTENNNFAESALDSVILSQSGLPRERSSLAMTKNKNFVESALDSAPQDEFDSPSKNPIIAFAALQILSLTLGEVRSLIVDEKYRRNGLATMLIEHLLAEARALNLKEVLALTYQREVFEKLGFKEIAKESLPNQKIWADCIKCKKFPVCDEIALTKIL